MENVPSVVTVLHTLECIYLKTLMEELAQLYSRQASWPFKNPLNRVMSRFKLDGLLSLGEQWTWPA